MCCCASSHIRKLEKIQCRTLRRILGIRSNISAPIVRLMCGVPNVQARFDLLKLNYFLKLLNSHSDFLARKIIFLSNISPRPGFLAECKALFKNYHIPIPPITNQPLPDEQYCSLAILCKVKFTNLRLIVILLQLRILAPEIRKLICFHAFSPQRLIILSTAIWTFPLRFLEILTEFAVLHFLTFLPLQNYFIQKNVITVTQILIICTIGSFPAQN